MLDRDPQSSSGPESAAGGPRTFVKPSFYERRQRRLLGAQARLQARRSRRRKRAALFAATFVAGLTVGVAATALGAPFLSARAPLITKAALRELVGLSSHSASGASPTAPALRAEEAVKPPTLALAPAASAPDSHRAAPAADPAPSSPSPSDARPPAPAPRTREPAAAPSPAASARADAPPASAPWTLPPRESVLELTTSVRDWVEAAKRRDLSTQIALYADRLGSFYGRRDLSREDVRAEKLRAFGDGEVLVDTGSLEIRLEASGQMAIVRFSKRYAVDDDGRAGRGEVEQELRWEHTDAGWRIVDENDAPTSSRLRGG